MNISSQCCYIGMTVIRFQLLVVVSLLDVGNSQLMLRELRAYLKE
ncbi:MAG: hypothetical protein QF551_03190 [Candidatus Marinimicrobia bacterium]|nr:hypothetical protein [Candidatus Neomarinimicrobiota bacterium]